MFKRITWLGTGMAIGAGGAFWAKRKVENTVERYLPDQVADRAATQARVVGRTVRAAATEGRDAMRQREQELRSQVEARTFVGAREATRDDSRDETVGTGATGGSRRAIRALAARRSRSVARRRSRR